MIGSWDVGYRDGHGDGRDEAIEAVIELLGLSDETARALRERVRRRLEDEPLVPWQEPA